MAGRRLRLMMVAGEPSGDELGGRLIAALRQAAGGEPEIFGIGGPNMQAGGLDPLFAMDELAVMGLLEVLPRAMPLLRRIRETAGAALARRPDVVVTIDSPDFNFRLAKHLAGRGLPLVHYVAPSVWAWRAGRARTVARLYDHLLALLPFEPPWFAQAGLDCTFVGHPVVESGAGGGDGRGFRARHGIPAHATLLAVLPGSRLGEVRRHLPVFARALVRLAPRIPHFRLLTATVPATDAEVSAAVAAWPAPVHLVRQPAEKFDAFAACDAALAVSGTVALELALSAVPSVITYRVNPLSGAVARRLLKVRFASLVNIILDRLVVPELLQENCRPDAIAELVEQVLIDPVLRDAQVEAGQLVAAELGAGGRAPSLRAADAIMATIKQRQRS